MLSVTIDEASVQNELPTVFSMDQLINKSGDKTYGLGKYWNSKQGIFEGVEISHTGDSRCGL